ncbi:MAG: RNA polymerase sigma factor [Weeksellaceae bacterium]
MQDERAFVQQIIARDEKALHQLFTLYYKPLYQFVHRRLYDKQQSEEIVQDILIHFLESLRDFRYQSSLKTFLYTIARNKVIDYMRKKKIKQVLFSAMPSFIVEGLAHVFMDDELEQKELAQKLEHTFEKLPHDYQVVLRLKYIEEQPVDEIALKLAKTFKSTESLLFRARKAFMKAFHSIA